MTLAPSGSYARRSGYLRPEPSPFLGRSHELDALDSSAVAGEIVSIVGPAGIGKTRLALRYGTTRQHAYSSVWFCDLTDANDVEEMTSIALRTFAKGQAGTMDAATAIVRALAARTGALVILDNVEHLLPGAATIIRRWAAAAPEVRFLVTSREPLDIAGERVVELGALSSDDAIKLFVERVRSRLDSYAPQDEELVSIAGIVRTLDGVPLAIELAAARIGSEHPRDVLERVTPHSSGEVKTRRAIERAFALLSASERATLCQCTVFRGSFTIHAAERVLQIEGVSDASAVVLHLAQRHVLQIERFQPMRFTMCEGIRAIAEEAFADSPEVLQAEWRHAQYFVERAELVASDRPVPADAANDWDDLRAAMAFGARMKRAEIVLRTALAIDALAFGSGLGSTQLAWLDEALGSAGDLVVLTRALGVRSNALYALGRLEEARKDAEVGLKLAMELGDARLEGTMRRAAAESAFQLGDFDHAKAHLDAALAIEQKRGDVAALGALHVQIGSFHNSLGNADVAYAEFERALALATRFGNTALEARAMMGLAWHHFETGDRNVAREHYERALALLRKLKMARSMRIVTGYLGVLYFDAGELEVAEDHLRRAAFSSRQAGDIRVEGIFEGVRAAVLATLDCVEEARESFDLAEQLLAGNPFYAGSIAVYRGHLDLAEARAHADPKKIEDARARIRAAREGADPLVARSDDARMAVRILERALSVK